MDLLRLFLRKRKPVILDLERYFPDWHGRVGQATHFGSKIFSVSNPKIHALRTDSQRWLGLLDCDKKRVGTPLRIVYYTLREMQTSLILITQVKKMGLQRVVIPDPADEFMLVDGNRVAVADFARNEGLSPEDFRDWYRRYAADQAIVIHFTDFRY